MSLFWGIVGYLLYVYVVIVLARVIVETTRQFARSWYPTGVAAIGVEAVYVVTDPPVKVLRRLIPPLRIGGLVLDLSIMILLLAILALYWVVGALA